ncbi:MAG: alpha-amylase family glycosyl hydrolase [Omnitrophica WOR_2 bacterium]
MSSSYLWWQTGVIYQIYPRSFKDASGDGIGDLAGIIEQMDYLSQTLGVDAIWLSPFYPSPMADFGYDVSDYTGVHPMFGDLDTFKRLLDEAHRRDLRVIIDYVPNHTSDQHPWFLESRSSPDNPKRDWYIWADAREGGAPPNNWLSNFGGSSWEWDPKTGQYYMHCFLKEQPDLNWRNPAVKEAMLDVLRFWMDLGVDGFRIDVAHYIMKDPELRDNPVNPDYPGDPTSPGADYDSQVHIHDKNHPDVHKVFRELRRLLDSYSQERPRMAVGEIHIFEWPEWVRHYGEKLDELHLPFNFSLMRAPWNAPAVCKIVDSLEDALPPGAWPNYVLGNHDEPRFASRYGRAQARVAALLLLTLRGTPTLYYGDEIGMVNVPIPLKEQQDPYGLRVPGKGRDPSRTAMQWTPGPNAGFSTPGTSRLWLPIAADYREYNVQVELDQPGSFLSLYRRLLAYRRASPALQHGSYQAVDAAPEDCFIYLRQEGEDCLLIVLNFSGEPQQVLFPEGFIEEMQNELGADIVLSTHLDRQGPVNLNELILRENEGLIIQL